MQLNSPVGQPSRLSRAASRRSTLLSKSVHRLVSFLTASNRRAGTARLDQAKRLSYPCSTASLRLSHLGFVISHPAGTPRHLQFAFPIPLCHAPPCRMKTVLLIDDDHAFRTQLTELLKTQGWNVFEAADGEDGLNLALQQRPDVVVCDLLMPRCNGFQFCRPSNNNALSSRTSASSSVPAAVTPPIA